MAAGMSKAEIARAVGRDSSVISQITSGKKPYANLEPTLKAVREQRAGREVTIPAAPRRMAKSGKAAKVRGKTNLAQGRTVVVKQQGVKSGASSIMRRLRQAADAGMQVAWTVTYPKVHNGKPVVLGKSPKYGPSSAHHASPVERTQTIELGNSGRGYSAVMWRDLAEVAGGDVGKALSDWITAQGLGDVDGIRPLSIELRTWQPRNS
jgi:hypothetical protein